MRLVKVLVSGDHREPMPSMLDDEGFDSRLVGPADDGTRTGGDGGLLPYQAVEYVETQQADAATPSSPTSGMAATAGIARQQPPHGLGKRVLGERRIP